jgi:hypothetical protein
MLTLPGTKGLHTPRARTGFLRKSRATFRSEPAAQSRSTSPVLVNVARCQRDKIVTTRWHELGPCVTVVC